MVNEVAVQDHVAEGVRLQGDPGYLDPQDGIVLDPVVGAGAGEQDARPASVRLFPIRQPPDLPVEILCVYLAQHSIQKGD